jgi:polar amino acid transport system substrate-binding protein
MNTRNVPVSIDPRVANIVRAGKVRVGLFPPQYTKDPVSGEPTGSLFIEIGRALAAHLGVEAELMGYSTPPKFFESLKAGACDLGFAGTERAGEVDCSPPFMELDYTFLAPAGSPIRSVADADRSGVRITAVSHHLSTTALRRKLKQAEMVGTETPDGAFDRLRSGDADIVASVRPVLLGYANRLPGSRVLDDRYGANLVTMVVAKEQEGWLAYISDFIEEAKASGVVRQAIDRAGWHGVNVAPPANLNTQK